MNSFQWGLSNNLAGMPLYLLIKDYTRNALQHGRHQFVVEL